MSSDSRNVHCGEDVAAYALGALDPEHARAFKRHLDDCELCRTDLASLRPVVEALPATAEPVDPPPELKKRIMAVVEAEAKERRAAEAPRRREGRFSLRVFAPVAAGLAAVVLALVLITGAEDDQSRSITATQKPPGTNVELKMEDGRGTLVVEGMLAPDKGRVYQVWKKRGDEAPEPTDALFTPRSDGHASVAVPGDMTGVDQVLVSTEPPGGSKRPTTSAAIVVET